MPDIEMLRHQRGVLVADEKPHDKIDAEIEQAEREDAARADGEAERGRRERAAIAAAVAKQIEILKVELSALARSYLDDTQEAEAFARGGAAALGRMLQTAQQMARISHQISGRETPIPLLGTELERRLGCRHTAVMSTIPGHRHRLGPCEWLPGHYVAETKPRDAEQALLVRHVQPLTEGE